MKKYKAPFPKVIEIFKDQIDFGINDKIHALTRDDLVAMEGMVYQIT